jgi:uncharacterized membrane protein YhdT
LSISIFNMMKYTIFIEHFYTLQYVVPVVVNCSYCTPDVGYGKYPKHVELSCNKIKILVLHLVRHFVCVYIENDVRNREPKMLQICTNQS